MILLTLVPIFMGAGLATQTAINSKLREQVLSPYLASAISFLTGSVFLMILTIIQGSNLIIPLHIFHKNPWWIWSGGVLGVIALTTNLLLFSKLGAIQTAILPILGQVIMGIIIDTFGLINSPKSSMTLFKVIGLTLVMLGVIISTKVSKSEIIEYKIKANFLWKILGVSSGMLMSLQAAINGYLGIILKSPVHSAFISFTIGAILLIILVMVLRIPFSNIHNAIKLEENPWWIWIGGLLGAMYVLGNAWLIPRIGTGQVVIMALFGQLLFSALIEQFSLFGALQKHISYFKIIGLAIIFIGVLLIRIF